MPRRPVVHQLGKARVWIAAWRRDYDERLRHSASKYQTPPELAALYRRRRAGDGVKQASQHDFLPTSPDPLGTTNGGTTYGSSFLAKDETNQRAKQHTQRCIKLSEIREGRGSPHDDNDYARL